MPSQRHITSHGDTGLQPERTDLAWRRTTFSLVVVGAVLLRWIPHHGWFVGTLVTAAIVTAAATHFTRKRRFHRAVQGINSSHMAPDLASTAAVAISVIVLALLGIYTVLFLPLEP